MKPRAAFAMAALAPAVILGIPLQWLALRTSPGLARIIPKVFHRWVNLVLGIRRTVVGLPHRGRPLLLAAGHSSWLDITVLAAVTPVSFVAKSEVATWPLFGLFARLQRTVFVNRTRRSDTGRTTAEMAERLGGGDALVLFPEGTSNDGNRVYPFRSALLGAASALLVSPEQEVWVQPVTIVYHGIGGLPGGRRVRPRLAWYGDMDLGPHLLGVLAMGAIDVTVAFGDPVRLDAGTDRKILARQLERAVRGMAASARRGA
jgi:1-acyl-sn-glycerol-3-phosphate acyltransferase